LGDSGEHACRGKDEPLFLSNPHSHSISSNPLTSAAEEGSVCVYVCASSGSGGMVTSRQATSQLKTLVFSNYRLPTPCLPPLGVRVGRMSCPCQSSEALARSWRKVSPSRAPIARLLVTPRMEEEKAGRRSEVEEGQQTPCCLPSLIFRVSGVFVCISLDKE
jgi:hypothetical protein